MVVQIIKINSLVIIWIMGMLLEIHIKKDWMVGALKWLEGGTVWGARAIHDTFVAHTNMVARQMPGQATALGWNKDNNAQFQFMMQIGYQAGSDWYRKSGPYSQLAEAIRTGDATSAVAALRATPAYKLSQDSRKQYYEQTLIAGMSE